MNPDLDLTISRIIRAPRKAVWAAWTDPARFAKWFIPAPLVLRVDRLEAHAGGGLVTQMSEDGVQFTPHMDASFLVVEEFERLVFTNAIDSSWRPVSPEPVALTAEIIFRDHADGTDYQAIVRHGDPASRARHEEMGFFEGWATVTKQLAEVAEQ
ncbi:SRPBCC domain-containing protein [Kibdelosporangium philippinense]|uniref:SRPBCC domain-containing protein n=1 Tax=Kibdelosporangium philippinense TaxID=211113 RepID=A0ABS8ZUF3_9PSEU|nr:SRPBCC domain-containing protein [Kibdelosporangium philippinense]MCE7011374.1 SRPBCC domain-containing protein [Kibdelosporangium philippinense]